MLRDLFPGGYAFSSIVFWAVVALVAVGTNIVPIALSVGLGMLALEFIARARS